MAYSKTIALTGGTSWSKPADWNDADNRISVYGGGANGVSGTNTGGGAACVFKVNYVLSGSTISYAIAAIGGDTTFDGAVFTAKGTATFTGGPTATSVVPAGGTKNAGGNGINSISGQEGGGGCAGVHGAGNAATAGTKGGDADAGNDPGGIGSSTGGVAGGNGSQFALTAGGTAGPGGGGFGASGNGGNYGAGGGASTHSGSAGTPGLIIIEYNPISTSGAWVRQTAVQMDLMSTVRHHVKPLSPEPPFFPMAWGAMSSSFLGPTSTARHHVQALSPEPKFYPMAWVASAGLSVVAPGSTVRHHTQPLFPEENFYPRAWRADSSSFMVPALGGKHEVQALFPEPVFYPMAWGANSRSALDFTSTARHHVQALYPEELFNPRAWQSAFGSSLEPTSAGKHHVQALSPEPKFYPMAWVTRSGSDLPLTTSAGWAGVLVPAATTPTPSQFGWYDQPSPGTFLAPTSAAVSFQGPQPIAAATVPASLGWYVQPIPGPIQAPGTAARVFQAPQPVAPAPPNGWYLQPPRGTFLEPSGNARATLGMPAIAFVALSQPWGWYRQPPLPVTLESTYRLFTTTPMVPFTSPPYVRGGGIRGVLEQPYSGEALLFFLTISHPQLQTPLYLVNDNATMGGVPVSYLWQGNTYVSFPFTMEILSDGDGPPTGKVVAQNIDRQVGEIIRNLVTPVHLSVAIMPASDFNLTVATNRSLLTIAHIIYEADGLTIRNVVGDAVTVTGDVQSIDDTREPWPGITATQNFLPGLYR